MELRWCEVLLAMIDEGVADGSFTCPAPGRHGGSRLGAHRRSLRGRAGLPHDLPGPAARLGRPDGRPRARGSTSSAPPRRRHVTPTSGLRRRDRSGPDGPAGSPVRSVAVPPSTTRSASSRPKVGANLNPCAAPRPTTTDSCPGTGAITKSRSGVSVYWQREERTAAPLPGSRPATKEASRCSIAGSGLRGPVVGVDGRSTAVLGGLDRRFAVAREAVEGRVVHPDPQRHPLRRESARFRRLEVGHLLDGHLDRHVHAEVTEDVVDPCVRADHEPATTDRPGRGCHLDPARAEVFDARDRGRAAAGRRRASLPPPAGSGCCVRPARWRHRVGRAPSRRLPGRTAANARPPRPSRAPRARSRPHLREST